MSLEVEPAFAHNSDDTLAQARDFWKRVDRPNLMIKIPGTDEGVPAIEAALTEGININITLLFGVEAYERVMDAYVKAMEARLANGDSLDVHSVASFFVSRVDTEVDKRLEELGRRDLRGKAAVANARDGVRPLQARLPRRALRRACRGRLSGAAPAVGVDGRQGPRVPRDQVRRDARGARHREHDADGDARGLCARSSRSEPDTAEIDPSADLAALAEAGIDME